MANTLYFIGTQLLFLSEIASPFILLTANMDDVKNIAQKFVSESLAEKITEFVAKATEDVIADISIENEESPNNVRFSSEDTNTLRQRETTKKKPEHARKEKTEENKGQVIDWAKEVKEIIQDQFSKAVDDEKMETRKDSDQDDNEKNNDQRDYDQERADYEQSKIDDKEKIKKQREQDYEEQKVIYDRQMKEKNEETDVQSDQDPEPKENSVYSDKTHKRKRIKQKPSSNNRQKNTKNTDSIFLHKNMLRQEKEEFKKSKEKTAMESFRGFNIQRSMTTEKERTEFDQYDYPKSEFIATSGPVALPRVAMIKPWWEKEMIPQ